MQVQDIVFLYETRGHLAYEGEGISQIQHGWQCARLARQAGGSVELQLASWLHDLGHLMTDLEGSPTTRGIDDGHEALAAEVLGTCFGDSVAQPVALHVLAKRCLVGMRHGYRDSLSADSTRSLALQGGPMNEQQIQAFMQRAHAADALKLRVWDDLAKRADLHPESQAAALDELRVLMERVLPSKPS